MRRGGKHRGWVAEQAKKFYTLAHADEEIVATLDFIVRNYRFIFPILLAYRDGDEYLE